MAGATTADALVPMPGVVDKVYVQPGDSVEEGQPMLVMIAMKMEVGYCSTLFTYHIHHCRGGCVVSFLLNMSNRSCAHLLTSS